MNFQLVQAAVTPALPSRAREQAVLPYAFRTIAGIELNLAGLTTKRGTTVDESTGVPLATVF